MRNYSSKHTAFALLLSFPLLLTGCSPKNLPIIGKFFGGGSQAKEITLTVWGLWESEQTMSPLFQKYTSEHSNVKINYQDMSIVPLVDYKERVFTRAVEGTKPDLVMAHASWVPRLVSGGGAWASPAGIFESGYLDANFFPVVKSAGVIGGNLYSLPSMYDGLVLVYNKKHFEAAGITVPPADWEEFRRDAISLTIKDKDRLVRAGAAVGLADNIDHFSDVLGLMFSQADVAIPDKIDSEQAQDALTFYTNFAKEDGVWDASLPESLTAFAQDRVSMILVPTWRLYELLSNMSDSSVLGVAPVPQALPDTPVTWATYWTWVVPKSSPYSNESWELIKFLVDPVQQASLYSEASKMRTFGAVYSDITLAQGLLTNKYLKAVVETAPYAKTAEIAGRAGNRRQYDALKQAVNDVLAGKSAQEALVIAKAVVNK